MFDDKESIAAVIALIIGVWLVLLTLGLVVEIIVAPLYASMRRFIQELKNGNQD